MPAELDLFIAAARAERGGLFDPRLPITVARAPAWVDLLGGADPAGGSLALGWPLADSSFVALQPVPEPSLRIQLSGGASAEIGLDLLQGADGWPHEYAAAAAGCATLPEAIRAVAAAWLALMREEFARFPGGARLLLRPAGGPQRALSIVTATAQALVSAYGVRLPPRELALACQMGLDRLVGLSAGALGPITAVSGAEGELLLLHQQPAWLWGSVRLPYGSAIWALRVGDGPPPPPARTSTAAAMAARMLADAAGLSEEAAAERWRGYLANVGTAHFERRYRDLLPAQLSGADYLARYGQPAHGPPIDPAEVYPLRAAAALPLEEHLRARTAVALLRAAASKSQREDDLQLVGELLAQSHWAQRAAGYGDTHADALADMVNAAGPGEGLYGARAAAAPSGANVVVLGRADGDTALRAIATVYAERSGITTAVFGGSAPGCGPAGAREI
jgi:galactokinase